MARKTTKRNTADLGHQDVDLNQIVGYNFRRARELRGWTQEEAADHLQPLLGQRLPQTSISAIERAYSGEHRRVFDAHEILAFSIAFNLPLIWFFLPPEDDRAHFQGIPKRVSDLYEIVLGREDQLTPIYERLSRLGIKDPTELEETMEKITGAPAVSRQSYRERRKRFLLALLDSNADNLDRAADDLGSFFDHIRQVGVRGYVAEHLNDEEFTYDPEARARIKEAESQQKDTDETE
jgi:transcriptional regulator with XRE-family HTH domain